MTRQDKLVRLRWIAAQLKGLKEDFYGHSDQIYDIKSDLHVALEKLGDAEFKILQLKD